MQAEQRLETRSLPVYWLGKYCDTIENLWLLGQQASIFEEMMRLTELQSGESCLDVGCGTGNLCVVAKRMVGDNGWICAVDAAPKMVELTRERAARARLDIDVSLGLAERLNFPDGSFDMVISSFMFHHLPLDEKHQAFREFHRVLKPGGRFLVVDEGVPGNTFVKLVTYPIRYHVQLTKHIHWYEHMADNVKGAMPSAAQTAGFENVCIIQKRLGWIDFLHGNRNLDS